MNYIKTSFYQHSFEELESIFLANGYKSSVVQELYNWHYKKKNTQVCAGDISKKAIAFISQRFDFRLPQISAAYEAEDKTVKLVFELYDKQRVESVLIPFHNKYSLCISSQVGCAMGCTFCYTGKQGLKRNLLTGEIIGQFIKAWNWLEENRPNGVRILNIVFMGQGEPLHNFDAVKTSCEILLSQSGASIGKQKITISTAGFIPGLKRWAKEIPGVNLALSLHSPLEHKRSKLIPLNKRFSLPEVLELIGQIPLEKKQFITYEYLLIDNFNDYACDAHETGKLLEGKDAYVNLIPFNPFPGSQFRRPSLKKVQAFKAVLDTYKIPTLVRETKGEGVLAACGQLSTDL